jgi:predicted phosphodiesterase
MSLRLGVLADVHYSLDPAERGAWVNPYDFDGLPARIDLALRWFAEQDVDVVVLGGDLTHRGDATSLRALLQRCVNGCAQPLLVAAGNHDTAPSGGCLAGEVAVDTARLALADPQGEHRDHVRVAGVQVASAQGWFQARLDAPPVVSDWGDEPVVLISHFPLLSHAMRLSERGLPYPGDLIDRDAAAAQLGRRCAPTVVVSGHIHARDVLVEGPVLQLTQAALIEPPYEASVVEIAVGAGQVHVARRATALAGPEPAAPPPLLVPGEQRFEYTAGAWQEVPVVPVNPVSRSTPCNAVPAVS